MRGTPESKDTPREKRESVSLLPPAVTPPSIYVLSKSACTLNMSIELQTTTSLCSISTSALLNSGATGMFVNQVFAQKHKLETRPLPNPVPVHNIDGTPNENGSIMEEVKAILQYGQHTEKAHLAVTNLGWQTIIIRHSWLTHPNLEVDWARQSVTMSQCPPECQGQSNRGMAEDDGPEPRDAIYAAFIPPEWAEHHIRAMDTPSQWLAQEVQKAEVSQPLKDMVLAQYHDFRDVFSKEAFDELPPWKAWDHAIDLSPGTELPHSQTFPLSPAEQKELDDFLWENLANGCICPSKSPTGAPVFFVKKKDGSLHLVQDYWKLNEIMVKNSYPLPLISDVLTHLHNAKFFTVLDLQWGFNNVWIKEGDEWKAAFQTNRGLFEPTIIFFRLCNSPAMFQMMMNDLLREFIHTSEAI